MVHKKLNSSSPNPRPTEHWPQGTDGTTLPQIQIAQGQGELDPRLYAMVDAIEAGVVVCDRQRAITVMNRAARRRLLPQAQAPISLDAVTFYRPGNRTPLPPDDLPLWRALMGQDLHDLELAIVHSQGDRYVVLASGQPLIGPGGEVQGAVMTLYDITQRYHAESMLRSSNLGLKTEAHQRLEDLQAVNEKLRQESTQRQQAELALQHHRDYLQTIFDTEPACVKVMNSAGQIQFVNTAGLALLGVSEANHLLGQSMQPLIAPEWQTTYWAFHQRVCAGEKGSLEYEIINCRGDRHWVESHATPLADEITGQPLHLDVTRDITQRQRAEQALRDSEERFRATFEQAAVGIAHVAPDGTWLRVNQTLCTLVGYSHDELLGLTLQAITHPDDLASDRGYMHEMLAGQRQRYTIEKRYLRQDQGIVWVQLTVSLVRDEQQPKYFIVVIQDVTAAKQADETLRHYAQRLQGLHTMDRAILAQFQPHGVARSALSLLCQLLDCQQGIVTLFDREAQQGEIIADTADDALFPAGTRLPLSDFVFAQRASRSRMRRVKSIAQLKHPPLIFQCFLATNLRSAMTVPLLVNGNVIGEVTLADHRRDHFQADHEEVIQEVTDHLAIALQNARLFEQVTIDRQRLKDLSSQLLETQETERRVLAHELHDEIGQALTAVKLSLRRLERQVDPALAKTVLDDCVAITDEALQKVRNLSLDLRPSMLDDLGLVPALRWYVGRHAERTGLSEQFTCDADLSQLSAQIKTACFRIVQEALTNVARHAQAQTVRIALVVSAQRLHLTIQDDGIGFDIDALRYAKSHGTSLGLLGMEERSLLIGGHLSFTSAPGQGTGVNLWVPLSSA